MGMKNLTFPFKKLYSIISKKEVWTNIVGIVLAIFVQCSCTVFLLAPDAGQAAKRNNCILVLVVFALLLALVRRCNIALAVTSILISVIYYVDQFVLSIRYVHISYQDFFSAGDAMRVVNRYTLMMTSEIAIQLGRVLLLNILYFIVYYLLVNKNMTHKHRAEWIEGGVLFLVLICFVCFFMSDVVYVNIGFDTNDFAEKEGLLYSWVLQYKMSKIEEPENYSEERAENILNRYQDNSESEASDITNIIVIMNESFTDYDMLGTTDFAQDPLPYFHAMQENCIKGSLAVSVYGGGTCNSEFEFLTGCSMFFLPQSSYPYVRYINQPTPSLCYDFTAEKYTCIAVHPYYGIEWKRETVYPNLGFEDFLSVEDFTDVNYNTDITNDSNLTKGEFGELETVRGFVSDAECYRQILNIIDDTESSFVFAVTVQNHGGYTHDSDIFDAQEFTGDEKFDTYLSSIQISDEAFAELLTELEQRPEKTVVLMFGDHHPGIQTPNVEYDEELLEAGICDYIVPYVIWTNYDSDMVQSDEIISSNYLSAIFKEAVGLPLTEWDEFRLDVAEEYPVLTSNFVIDKNGICIPMEDVQENEILQEYEVLQYYRLFDGN